MSVHGGIKNTLREKGQGIARFFLSLKGNRRALIGLVIWTFFLLMATIGPFVVPLDLTSHYAQRFRLPSIKHVLGTDYVGRDVFQELVHGSRDVMVTAFLAGFFAVAIAVIVGGLAGFKGGYVDMVLMRTVDVLLTIPHFPIMMVFATMLRVRDPISIGFILAIWMWAGLARDIRSQILSLKEREFIEAAKLLRLSTPHILFHELIPNVMPYIIINFVQMVRGGLTASVGLMFLGLIPYSPTNWGMMLNLALFQAGTLYVPSGIFYILAPMGSIMLFQYGGLSLAYGLDELFNPRLRAHE